MLELLLGPKKAERRPIEMFLVGIFYSFMALLLSNWVFSGSVLSNYSGLIIVTFLVMFTIPFTYFLFRYEEQKELKYTGKFKIIKEHSKAIVALMWLFLGFVIAFSFWYIITGNTQNFQAQIETFCYINHPSNFDLCVGEYIDNVTGNFISSERFLTIFLNNIYVLMFTLIFSLIFGAGVIFILAWNASVIAVAIGIFARTDIKLWPIGIARYMIHGIPEIAAYFVGALAGGIISMAVIKQDLSGERLKEIFRDFLILVFISIALLFFAAILEIFLAGVF